MSTSKFYPKVYHDYTVVEFHEIPPIEVLNWCLDRYGHPSPERWFTMNRKIYFHSSNDHMMFLLRWS